MADVAKVKQLAAAVQAAADAYDPNNWGTWLSIHDAIDQLRKVAEPPALATTEQFGHTIENITINIAEEIGLFQILANNRSKSFSATDLAEITGYDAFFLSRILRLLTAIGFVDETGYQTCTANDRTIFVAQPGARGELRIFIEWLWPVAGNIPKFLSQHKPCDSNAPPMFDVAYGQSLWELMRQNSSWRNHFDACLSDRVKTHSTPWHVKYPAKERLASRDKPVIIDIGGNRGNDLMSFAKSAPELKCDLVLQEMPETLKGLIPGSLEPSVRAMPYDAMTEQPIKGADIYYLKSVLHDFDDAGSQKILSNIAQAMQSHSRLLINEYVLADTNEKLVRAQMDILMLLNHNGMERTKTHWEQLLAKAEPPLKIVEVWSHPADQQSVIEACLAN